MAKKKGRILGSNAHGLPYSGRGFTATSLHEYRLNSLRDYEELREAKRKAIIERLRTFIRRRDDGTISDDDDEDDLAWQEDGVYHSGNADIEMLERIMGGKDVVELSNAGIEFEELVKVHLSQGKYRKKRDPRSRQDYIEKLVAAFAHQMPWMIKTYMEWSYNLENEGLANETAHVHKEPPEGSYTIKKVDAFSSDTHMVKLYSSLPSIAASCIRDGIIPCAPDAPTVGVSIRVLELFRTTSMRCPYLSIQAFVKSLCDVHQFPYMSYLSRQFSVCYDVYLDILNGVNDEVIKALGRDGPNWRLKHACVPCTYKLRGEPSLRFSMLLTMDGNNSLKRLARTAAPTGQGGGGVGDGGGGDGGGEGTKRDVERSDPRVVHGDYYLSREEVDSFADEARDQIPTKDDSPGDPNHCDDRWKNMASDHTSKMWGVFDEAGVFLVLCRHGHVMLVMDMVRTGEQTKYPLAAVNTLHDAFGADLGIGYDIGCQFSKTLHRSRLANRAKQLRTTCLVGSFHGHAHNRLCQLKYLATYVEGLGLEDLEGCERFFSKSNALAASIRHASIFHRRQKINEYIKHLDNKETYLALSTFLINNYKQALEILSQEPALLKQMHDQQLGSDFTTFQRWLEEEHQYLTNLKREPLEETLHMEYYDKLCAFYKSESRLTEMLAENWCHHNPQTTPLADEQSTRVRETARRHAQEKHLKSLDIVQSLERQLNIDPAKRWLPGDEEWVKARDLVSKRRYQRAVDRLESLVVARMFELTKMNMSQTGYKMRQHIGKALQSRSAAIQTALKEFNDAATAIGRSTLTWEQVVQYAQLADFDLLSDTREDVRKRPWAKPGSRQLLDQYFKVLRAREEVIRLNVEIRRLTTFIRDEEAILAHIESNLRASQPHIAHQLSLRLSALARMNDVHITRLQALAKLPGFSGSIDEGIRLEPLLIPTTSDSPIPPTTAGIPTHCDARSRGCMPVTLDADQAAADDEDQDIAEQEALDVAFAVLQLGDD